MFWSPTTAMSLFVRNAHPRSVCHDGFGSLLQPLPVPETTPPSTPYQTVSFQPRLFFSGRQRGAPDGDHVGIVGRDFHAVAFVPRCDRDRDPGVVVGGHERRFRALRGAVAVADLGRPFFDGLVHRHGEVFGGWGAGLDQQDVAFRADRRDHVEVEGDLFRPFDVLARRDRAAALVDLAEAAARARALAGCRSVCGTRSCLLRRWGRRGRPRSPPSGRLRSRQTLWSGCRPCGDLQGSSRLRRRSRPAPGWLPAPGPS